MKVARPVAMERVKHRVTIVVLLIQIVLTIMVVVPQSVAELLAARKTNHVVGQRVVKLTKSVIALTTHA